MTTRRPRRALALTVTVALLGTLVSGCAGASGGESGGAGSRSVNTGASDWEEGATVDSVAQALRVVVPSTATGTAAARRNGFQDDGLIMSFLLPRDAVDPFLSRLKPERPLRLREQPFAAEATPATPFAHLGLPEPDSLPQVREGQVCAPCEGGLNWLKVAVAQIDAHSSRVYLQGVD